MLKVGDKIKILLKRESFHNVKRGEVYEVREIESDGTVVLDGGFAMSGPQCAYQYSEGIHWERV